MDLKRYTKKLIQKHQTSDPFQIAKELGITIFQRELGNARGFYKRILKRKYIFVNSELNTLEKRVVCAHELGHALLHSKQGLRFMLKNNMLKKVLLETDANEFALHLVFDENNSYTKEEYEHIKEWIDNNF